MKKNNRILIICVITAFFIIMAYVLNFRECSISKSPSDWSNFSSYFNGLITPILTFINILVLIGVKSTIDDISKEHKLHIKRIYQHNKDKSNEYKLNIVPNATIEDNIKNLEVHYESIKKLFDSLKKSDESCETDLYALAERAKLNDKAIRSIKNIPYYENPFVNRMWETHNLSVNNTMLNMYKDLLQLKVNAFKLQWEKDPNDMELSERYKKSVKELEDYLREISIAD